MKTVKEQFGKYATEYVTSKVHAQGGSLARLLALSQPQPAWQVLDVATGGGHTAFAFSPHVAHVIATDLTPQMLVAAQTHGKKLGVKNVTFEEADAGILPYPDHKFDCVTCRIAPHHFPDVAAFVGEAYRVLKPGGKLAVADNIVPGSQRKGKKARLQREAGVYINAIEKLRDPSHGRALASIEWQDLFLAAGFAPLEWETLQKEMDFNKWSTRMGMPASDRIRLKAMFLQAPQIAADYLKLQPQGDNFTFELTEIIIVGQS